jgi:hypothetical protein
MTKKLVNLTNMVAETTGYVSGKWRFGVDAVEKGALCVVVGADSVV